jgi:hypothetical protein
MSNNCSNGNSSSNSCSPCEGCEIIVSGSCVTYDGTGISGLSYPENATINQMIYALGTLLISLQAQVDSL